MAGKTGFSVVFLFGVIVSCGSSTVWTIRERSHPYKTQIYTAELIRDSTRYLWCADHIDREDAVVLCNQVSEYYGLGHYDVDSTRVEFGALHFDPAAPEFFMNETFACVGNESRLTDCPMVPVADRCPSENVGQVDCNPADNARKNLTASLVSHMPGMGAVKMENPSLTRMSGLICEEEGLWGRDEADVACRSLGQEGLDMGFPVDVTVVTNHADLLPLSFVMKNVRCEGTEASLNDCPHQDMCMAEDYLSKTFDCPDRCDGEIAAVVCG